MVLPIPNSSRNPSLSTGPQRNVYGAQGFTSHPLNRPLRSFFALGPTRQIMTLPLISLFSSVPAINIRPNTPSVFGSGSSG